jgi:hypothetical protein
MSLGSWPAADVAGISIETAISAIAIGMDSQRLAVDRCRNGFMTRLLVLSITVGAAAPRTPSRRV